MGFWRWQHPFDFHPSHRCSEHYSSTTSHLLRMAMEMDKLDLPNDQPQ
jgi:hypothetical protein